jgi:hypothetical protein
MATFIGTEKEFIKFVGPLIRNLIQNKTRPHKKKAAKGVCEGCKETRELQAAHVHGNDRLQIIRAVLSAHNSDGVVKCELELVVKKIISAHMPIGDFFKFLCESCHKDYDAGKLRL